MPRYGLGAEGQAHLQQFWLLETSGEIPENSGTEVSTSLCFL